MNARTQELWPSFAAFLGISVRNWVRSAASTGTVPIWDVHVLGGDFTCYSTVSAPYSFPFPMFILEATSINSDDTHICPFLKGYFSFSIIFKMQEYKISSNHLHEVSY